MKQQPTKKLFKSPELVVYGDIRDVTQSAVGNQGDDGATQGNSKTSQK
jgi:hypothetical protein